MEGRVPRGHRGQEIATRLVTSEENVQKRAERARIAMRSVDLDEEPSDLPARTESVLRIIYVLFTEGCFASSGDDALRLELCEEAIRLGTLVASHPRYTSGSAWALLALMHLHHARRDARTGPDGEVVLVEEQDRTRYRRDELALAFAALERAGEDVTPSKYKLEAAIAGEHAFAPSFREIRWGVIARHYAQLEVLDPSPLHGLHRAIARSYAEGPDVALRDLERMRPPTWLEGSHLWLATHADLYRRLGDRARAVDCYEKAIALAPPHERLVLRRRLRATSDELGEPPLGGKR
jgi:RNA polymerase sigma-70 factor (ECF subfamily)